MKGIEEIFKDDDTKKEEQLRNFAKNRYGIFKPKDEWESEDENSEKETKEEKEQP